MAPAVFTDPEGGLERVGEPLWTWERRRAGSPHSVCCQPRHQGQGGSRGGLLSVQRKPRTRLRVRFSLKPPEKVLMSWNGWESGLAMSNPSADGQEQAASSPVCAEGGKFSAAPECLVGGRPPRGAGPGNRQHSCTRNVWSRQRKEPMAFGQSHRLCPPGSITPRPYCMSSTVSTGHQPRQ